MLTNPGPGTAGLLSLAIALILLTACDPPPRPRREGVPLAAGEAREAGAWRVRDGLVISTIVETGEPLTRNVGATAPRFGGDIGGLSYWGNDWQQRSTFDPAPQATEHGFLWVDHGGSGSWLRVERDDSYDWSLTLTSANSAFPVPHARTVTPWGSLWNAPGARDWPPEEGEEAALPLTGPAGCGWDQLAFALSADSELVEGAPIVLYALAGGSPTPFKLVSNGVYDARFGREQLLEVIADARLFRAEQGRGRWVAGVCPARSVAPSRSRDLEVGRGTARLFFTTRDGIEVIEELDADAARSSGFARAAHVSIGRESRSGAVPMATDRGGALWFANGDQLFRWDADSPAGPAVQLTAPRGSNIVALAWGWDYSTLFLGLQPEPDRASVVAVSAL